MKILVTGTAGFIGFHLVKRLMQHGDIEVVGIDNINDYYDVNLKYGRLFDTGIEQSKIKYNTFVQSSKYSNYRFVKLNLEDRENINILFEKEKFDIICNLAAQAGVRYSIDNPYAYIQSNIIGFMNILECCRQYDVKKLIYASSSSVYGMNHKIPFSEDDFVDRPVSLYAATKKSNELMAHTYSHLYNIETIGLRFFTVYGPWGRPDMAPMLFARAIIENKPIKVFNSGELSRDFTYIDDVVEGIYMVILESVNINQNKDLYQIYNIGNSKPIELMDFISKLENAIGKKGILEMYPMQQGDVKVTYADVSKLTYRYDYAPSTALEKGIKVFADWYIKFEMDTNKCLKI